MPGRPGAGHPPDGSTLAFLRAIEIFSSMPDDALEELAAAAETTRLRTGDQLMREGDPADAVYVVRHGRMRTFVHVGEERKVIGEIGRGEVVGEMALLTDHVRTATVEALRDSELLRIDAARFARLLAEHPAALRPVAATLVDRLRQAVHRSEAFTVPSTIALVPLTPGATEWFATTLEAELRALRRDAATLQGDGGAERSAAELLDVEAQHDHLLLVADVRPTPWTRQCLRHAELVLLVAAAGDGAPSPVERDADCADRLSRLRTELVVLFEGEPDAVRWLRQRDVGRHHNVELHAPRDVARVARIVSGRALAVVLSGGGARGLAHIGVLKAFDDAGLAIDAIAGTSAGSLVAGGYALVRRTDEIEVALREFLDEVRWAGDLTVPSVALLNGRKMTEALRRAIGETPIENLRLDYFAVSTDLTARAPHVHVTGPLWRAVRASASVPGIFPPVRDGDHLLVDGGVVANLPTGIMRHRHPSATIVGSDVGTGDADLQAGAHSVDGVLGGWGVFIGRLRGTDRATPSMPRILARLTELGRRDDERDAADLVVAPDVANFALLDGRAIDPLIDAGYRAGKDAAAQLLTFAPGA
jgi:NTE family protein